ncbi:tetratricopeptide repeat protein [Thermodesulfobacteriota bacterium]
MSHSAIKTFSIILLLVILGFGVYSNSLDSPFVFDDILRIKDNPHVRLTHFSLEKLSNAAFKKPSARNRPVGNIAFALNYYFHQYNLKGYHAVNIIIHILTGILLFYFINTTLSITAPQPVDSRIQESLTPAFAAFWAALVWLVNPVHTQSVTYIVQRLNSMAAMFYLLSFLFYVKGRIHQIKRATQTSQSKTATPSKPGAAPDNRITVSGFYFIGSCLTWILALGCKQTSATLPFFIFLYEWYFFHNLNRDWLKRHLKYFSGVILLFGLISMIYTGFNPLKKIISSPLYAFNNFTFAQRVLTQPRVVIYYLSLIFYPHPSRLNLDYDFPLSFSLIDPVTTLLSLFAIIGLVAFAFYVAKKERLISFCILWYFGNLVIESSIIPLALIYEHRTYLPSMLVCLMLIMLAVRYIKPKWLTIGILCAVVMICAVWTYERNRVWGSSVTLWEDCAKKSPNKAQPHNNLGIALAKEERLAESIRHYSIALDLKPDHAKAHNNLGIVLQKLGRIDESIRHYSKALEINPDYAEAHNNLGTALAEQGRLDDAIRHYSEALLPRPDYAKAHNNMGSALEKQGRIDEAVEHYLQALRIVPDFEEAHYNLGFALEKQGRIDEAVEHYLQALRIKPDYADAHINLGNALGKQGRTDEAVEHYFLALRIKPDIPEAYYNIGLILLRTGDIEEAISRFREAVRIKPDYVEAYNNLGVALYRAGNIEDAISRFREAVRIRPDYVAARSNLEKVLAIRQQNQ